MKWVNFMVCQLHLSNAVIKLVKKDDGFQLEGPARYTRKAVQLAPGHERFAEPALVAKDSLTGQDVITQRGDTEGMERTDIEKSEHCYGWMN